jgi:hypothetical protein
VNTGQRRLLLGIALVGSLLATRWVASQEEPAPDKRHANEAEQVKAAAAPTRAAASVQAAPVEELMIDRLNRAKVEPSADNLFETNTWQPPPPRITAKPSPPPPPTPPALPFSYFGKMSEDGRTIVFLNATDRSYAVRVGDVLEGRYKVEDIGDRSLVLTYLPLQQQQTLKIGD